MTNLFFFFILGFIFSSSLSSRIDAAELHAAKPLPENIQRIVDTNTYPPFVRECFSGAVAKLKQKAKAKEAVLKKETIAVDEVDNRWYSLSKYVWFSAKVETPEGVEKITVLMQKPLKGECF